MGFSQEVFNPMDPDYLRLHFEMFNNTEFHGGDTDSSAHGSIPLDRKDDDYCIVQGCRPLAIILRSCHIIPQRPVPFESYGYSPMQVVKNVKQIITYITGKYYGSASHLSGGAAFCRDSMELSEESSVLLRSFHNGEFKTCAQLAQLLVACTREMLNRNHDCLLLKVDLRAIFVAEPVPFLLLSVPREEAAPCLARALESLQAAIHGDAVETWHPSFEMYDNDTAAPATRQHIVNPFPSRQAHPEAVAESPDSPTRHCFNIFMRDRAASHQVWKRQKADGTMFTFLLPDDTEYVGLIRPSRTGHPINVAINFAERSSATFVAADGPLSEAHFHYHDGRNNGMLWKRLAAIHLYPTRAQALAEDLQKYLSDPEGLVRSAAAAIEKLRIDSDSSIVEVEPLIDELCMTELRASERLKDAKEALRDRSPYMEDSSRSEAVAVAERLYQQAHEQCCKRYRDVNGALRILELPDSVLYSICQHTFERTTASSCGKAAETSMTDKVAAWDRIAAWRTTVPADGAELPDDFF